MSEHHAAWQNGEDVQRLENALADGPVAPDTRRMLLRRASGVLAVGGTGALLAACGSGGSSSSSTTSAAATSSAASGSSAADEIKTIIDTAVTAEALAVTYLTGLVENAKATGVTKFVDVLKAANAAEYDHYKALRGLGAKPLTLKFWAPDAFFKPGEPFKVLQTAEALFVDAYLIGTTAFAKAGKASLARYAGEIVGVEAQHLALARFAAGKLPDDRGFQAYPIADIGGVVAALEKAGVGFGKPGAKPGKFYSFSPPPAGAVVAIEADSPK